MCPQHNKQGEKMPQSISKYALQKCKKKQVVIPLGPPWDVDLVGEDLETAAIDLTTPPPRGR